MAIRRRCSGTNVQEGPTVPGAPLVRRDVSREAISHAGERVRDPADGAGQTATDRSLEEARDWERHFIGEIKAGRDPRRPRSPRKSSDADTD